ncbi:hypothetical protein MBRA_02278 [Methylobacterium brachiatum]|nr:hypothetical protein MBRA_02278 [Methylobacterium brachiatum]
MDLRLDDIAWGTRGDPVAAARAVAAGAARRAGRHDHDGGFPAEDVAELARVGLLAAPVPGVTAARVSARSRTGRPCARC